MSSRPAHDPAPDAPSDHPPGEVDAARVEAKLDEVLALLRAGASPPAGPTSASRPDGPTSASDPTETSTEPPTGLPGSADPLGSDTFWALTGLRARLDDPDGGVLFTGTVTLPGGGSHAWQQGATTASLLDLDWPDLADDLAALGHPVRLQLLRLVATGTHTTAELARAEGLGTSGQLHHHVRHLVTAGWLRKAGRGRYEIPAPRLVPLLVVLAATQR
jgi:hypothetical protein